MISVSDARGAVEARARQLGTTRLSLGEALGCTLRENGCADADSPPFAASAMDGYAMRRADVPGTLQVIGLSAAGREFSGTIGAGQCVRILTGAPLPPGADWVVKQEDVERNGDTISVSRRHDSSYIRQRGENRRSGAIVVAAGTRLGPAEMAALASAGIAQPLVSQPARCVHVVTGDELVAPDRTPGPGQVRDSNSTLIAALLEQSGAVLSGHAALADEPAAAESALRAMPDHDLLLISGGASAGDHDFARPVLRALGYEIHFEQVNLRPGRPLVFAARGDRLAFALPGNPVSHWVVFQLFLRPLLEFFQTGSFPAMSALRGRLAAGCRTPPSDSRQTFWPCHATVVDGTYELRPLPLASSGDGGGLVGANALWPVPANSLDPAAPVEFISCP